MEDFQKQIDDLNEIIKDLEERIELLEESNGEKSREIQLLKNEIIRFK